MMLHLAIFFVLSYSTDLQHWRQVVGAVMIGLNEDFMATSLKASQHNWKKDNFFLAFLRYQ
jgi:hypothetical protein